MEQDHHGASPDNTPFEPIRGNMGGTILGPRNPAREQQAPDLVRSPRTDQGTMLNMRFSFADAHNRLSEGGWSRQVTQRELPSALTMAGVNMRLNPGSNREMHWHKEAEWAYMLKGTARVTSVDAQGRTYIDDVAEGDGWNFPSGIPHSIQALGDGCEFLLVFDSGGFSENSTFLVSDWLAHTPKEVIAANFGVSVDDLADLPKGERYIFAAPVPPSLDEQRGPSPNGAVPNTFTHRLRRQEPLRTSGGTVRILDSSTFPASSTIAAVLVEVNPGAMREMHWHPNADEWQYYISGQARMTVFGSSATATTFDFQAGDVGSVPFAMGHYVQNTGTEPLVFLEMFRSPYYADVSLNQWLALSPPQLVQETLNLNQNMMHALDPVKQPVIHRGTPG